MGKGAAVYLAAVLEYVTAEIVELAGNAARDNKRRRISARDLFLAMKYDEELGQLIPKTTFSQVRKMKMSYHIYQILQGGVVPSIQPVLVPKKKMKNQLNGAEDEAPAQL